MIAHAFRNKKGLFETNIHAVTMVRYFFPDEATGEDETTIAIMF